MDFTTPDLCDQFGAEVQVAEPLFRDFGGVRRFAGAIETVRVQDDNVLVREVLSGEGRDRVLVVDGGGSLRCALLGGQLATLAQTNGWTGVVVNGCVETARSSLPHQLASRHFTLPPGEAGRPGQGSKTFRYSLPG